MSATTAVSQASEALHTKAMKDNKAPTVIPVVDLQSVGVWHAEEPDDVTWRTVGKQLAEAFADIGFAYVTNHGIDDDVINRVFATTDEFFELTEEKKNAFAQNPGFGQGYLAAGRQRSVPDLSVRELRESYDFTDPDSGQYPDDLVPELRPAVRPLLDGFKALTYRLMQAMEYGLDFEPGFFVSRHTGIMKHKNYTTMRVLYYPPVPDDAPLDVIRCGAHTDFGTITLLVQDDMGGLEVKGHNKQWVAATPLPGALVINVGDMLQMWTEGKFVATEHRVQVPPSEHKRQRPRRSIAFFVNPDEDVVLAPPGEESRPGRSPLTAKQHADRRYADTFQY